MTLRGFGLLFVKVRYEMEAYITRGWKVGINNIYWLGLRLRLTSRRHVRVHSRAPAGRRPCRAAYIYIATSYSIIAIYS